MEIDALNNEIRVCICGGGNAPHVMAGLFAAEHNSTVKKEDGIDISRL